MTLKTRVWKNYIFDNDWRDDATIDDRSFNSTCARDTQCIEWSNIISIWKMSEKSSSEILKGVSICLTGFAVERKDQLHSKVVKLGGRYVPQNDRLEWSSMLITTLPFTIDCLFLSYASLRFTKDLLTKSTTHLIAEQPGGAKFEEAVKHSRKIKIVSPNWLEQCEKEKKKLPTDRFLILQSKENTATSTCSTTVNLTQDERHISLVQECDELLSPEKLPPNPLFSGLFFYLVGFDDDEEDDDMVCGRDGDETQTVNVSNLSITTLKQNLSRLLRRGMGTILWDLSDRITHVVVCQNCNLKAR